MTRNSLLNRVVGIVLVLAMSGQMCPVMAGQKEDAAQKASVAKLVAAGVAAKTAERWAKKLSGSEVAKVVSSPKLLKGLGSCSDSDSGSGGNNAGFLLAVSTMLGFSTWLYRTRM